MNKHIYLGIDPGLVNYGFVCRYLNENKEIIQDEIMIIDKNISFLKNFVFIINYLKQKTKDNNFKLIVIFERVLFYKYNVNYQKLFLLEYEIRKLLFNENITFWTYTSNQIKKYYLEKQETIAKNVHQLDALKLINLAINELNTIAKLTQENEINKKYLIEKWTD